MIRSASAVERVHGTALAVGARAVLIRGPSGAGKSDLALRCIVAPPVMADGPRAMLISDDQVGLAREGDGIVVSPPSTLAGKIEVRGLGVVPVAYCPSARLALVVDLVPPEAVPRYPLEPLSAVLLGTALPLLRLTPFEASAPAKVVLALIHSPEVLTPP